MAGFSEEPSPDGRMPDTSKWQKHNPSLISPYSLLGFGAALALVDTEKDVGRLTAGAAIAGLRTPLGVVVLQGQKALPKRVFGQLGDKPLEEIFAEEIEASWVLPRSTPDVPENVSEVRLGSGTWPRAVEAGLRRLLIARLRTIDREFGVLIAGNTADESYSPVQSASLQALAIQASMALQRIRLTNEHRAKDEALRKASDELELRVEQRTAELSCVNQSLRKQIEEREQAEQALSRSEQRHRVLLAINNAIVTNLDPGFLIPGHGTSDR